MRNIYLVRHGEPAFPRGASYCLGSEDLPLSGRGMREAAELRGFFAGMELCVYSSPLRRALDTARLISGSGVAVRKEFSEISSGLWEGRTFSEIMELWPEQYSLRGLDPWNTAPPGGESFAECAGRSFSALSEILSGSTRDILLVAHAGVIRSLLCLLSGERDPFSIPLPYCGISVLHKSGKNFSVDKPGAAPVSSSLSPAGTRDVPTRAQCFSILAGKELPENIVRHSEAVAALALELSLALLLKGVCLDTELIESAALLHDISRLEKEHAARGAACVGGMGYIGTASVIAAHMDLPPADWGVISEKSLVYLADKLVLEDRRVPLSERFERVLSENSGASAAAEIRLARARGLCAEFERLAGKSPECF